MNPKALKDKILPFYMEEFEDKLEIILQVTERQFFRLFTDKMRKIIKEHFNENDIEVSKAMQDCERIIRDEYYYHYYILSDHQDNSSCDFKFRKHCDFCDSTPSHKCKDSEEEGQFILVTKKGEITHVICEVCKACYLAKCILMYCSFCSVSYYSFVDTCGDLLPATWDKYHCKAIVNQQMICCDCNSPMFTNENKDLLICKKCNTQTPPKDIQWLCFVCKKQFNSNVKIYNPMEYKMIKKTIKEALLHKELAKPEYTSCCVEESITPYFHKKECPGILYVGEMDDRTVVVCEKCKMVNTLSKFVWTCPTCKKRFKDSKDRFIALNNSGNTSFAGTNYKDIDRSLERIEFSDNDFVKKLTYDTNSDMDSITSNIV
jgi:ribosomal protein L37AE/L43A